MYLRFLEADPSEVSQWADMFRSAKPFPHIVIPDAINLRPGDAENSWPTDKWQGWARFTDEYQRGKATCSDLALIPDPWKGIIQELSGPNALGFLERLTGIQKLIPDPYLIGGGLHSSTGGGILAPHTDFHSHIKLELYRRLNVLIYLNESWSTEDGGCLELFDGSSSESPSRQILPRWGTVVVFATDSKSVHGFTQPIADSKERRSIAAYYYTAKESPTYSGDTTTYWKQHQFGNSASKTRKARLKLYATLILASRSLAKLAHKVNPNL